MNTKNLVLEFLFIVFWLTMGFFLGASTSSNRELADNAKVAIAECQKDLPRSQVCELTAKVKEGKE